MAAGLPVLLLAAGASRRFGASKQLASIDGVPMVRRVACDALEAGGPVIVVLGAHATEVGTALSGLPLQIVLNPSWERGMGDSLAAGARALGEQHREASGVLVLLGDQPRVGGTALKRMIALHRDQPRRILATAHSDTAGPPALFPRDLFDALASCCGERGARDLLQAHAARLLLLHDIDARDVDTRDDLSRLGAADAGVMDRGRTPGAG